jgi:uncharacterized protein (TIGR03382 family)
MAFSPRFRDFALAIAVLFAAPAATYAHLLTDGFDQFYGDLLHVSVTPFAAAGVLTLGWLFRRVWLRLTAVRSD